MGTQSSFRQGLPEIAVNVEIVFIFLYWLWMPQKKTGYFVGQRCKINWYINHVFFCFFHRQLPDQVRSCHVLWDKWRLWVYVVCEQLVQLNHARNWEAACAPIGVECRFLNVDIGLFFMFWYSHNCLRINGLLLFYGAGQRRRRPWGGVAKRS